MVTLSCSEQRWPSISAPGAVNVQRVWERKKGRDRSGGRQEQKRRLVLQLHQHVSTFQCSFFSGTCDQRSSLQMVIMSEYALSMCEITHFQRLHQLIFSCLFLHDTIYPLLIGYFVSASHPFEHFFLHVPSLFCQVMGSFTSSFLLTFLCVFRVCGQLSRLFRGFEAFFCAFFRHLGKRLTVKEPVQILSLNIVMIISV